MIQVKKSVHGCMGAWVHGCMAECSYAARRGNGTIRFYEFSNNIKGTTEKVYKFLTRVSYNQVSYL